MLGNHDYTTNWGCQCAVTCRVTSHEPAELKQHAWAARNNKIQTVLEACSIQSALWTTVRRATAADIDARPTQIRLRFLFSDTTRTHCLSFLHLPCTHHVAVGELAPAAGVGLLEEHAVVGDAEDLHSIQQANESCLQKQQVLMTASSQPGLSSTWSY